jgi:hypothetical protein
MCTHRIYTFYKLTMKKISTMMSRGSPGGQGGFGGRGGGRGRYVVVKRKFAHILDEFVKETQI